MGLFSIKKELKFQQFAEMHPTILIIDDEDDLRKVIEEMFSILGCKTYSAENGKDGLDIYKQHKYFDLIILDMQMPIMNGRTAFKEIRKINPEQKILIISGYTKLEDLNDLIKSGAKGFVEKPFSIYTMIEKVKSIIFEGDPALKIHHQHKI